MFDAQILYFPYMYVNFCYMKQTTRLIKRIEGKNIKKCFFNMLEVRSLYSALVWNNRVWSHRSLHPHSAPGSSAGWPRGGHQASVIPLVPWRLLLPTSGRQAQDKWVKNLASVWFLWNPNHNFMRSLYQHNTIEMSRYQCWTYIWDREMAYFKTYISRKERSSWGPMVCIG